MYRDFTVGRPNYDVRVAVFVHVLDRELVGRDVQVREARRLESELALIEDTHLPIRLYRPGT